ncbi:MAG: glycosyltransferase [Cytophagales bacterium]|nr:glycosyltransferase [Cytophagales bacterium]
MSEIKNAYLTEIAWEVCNQVGGIYTVIRSKVPAIMEKWGDNYVLLGPYVHKNVAAEFEEITDLTDHYGKIVQKLRENGMDVHYGRWLVTGMPKVILFNPYSVFHSLDKIKYLLWEHHSISSVQGDGLLDQVVAFGYMVKSFFWELAMLDRKANIIAHFHEWMAGTPIPDIRKDNLGVKIVFTTHATLLGRYLAMGNPGFYEHLQYMDWAKEAKHFNIEAQVNIERAATHGAHVFSTVSDVTARECTQLLGRTPDVILPNGLNIERFVALHEFQNLHKIYKDKISEFVMGHFFQSYSFDLDNVLYFFTSGRFEYTNKGFDITVEALARLNWKMKESGINTTVVMFFITKQPYHTINPNALETRAVLEEILDTCENITKQIGHRFFIAAASNPENKIPNLNDFIDDYWKLRLRRTLQTWRTSSLPLIVTHNLVYDAQDPLLGYLRTANLINHRHDPVKVVYHPDFITTANPLFGMEYGQFVRGCHLGVFPSYYEPWGYTPLECIASGVPTITSDLAGFGDFVVKTVDTPEEKGIYVVNRRTQNFHDAAEQMANQMLNFVKQNRRERIKQRNRTEAASASFDWTVLTKYYDEAYEKALNSV